MLIFGHIGITLGIGLLAKYTLHRVTVRKPVQNQTDLAISLSRDNTTVKEKWEPWWLAMFHLMDLRLLLIGSLLPDIIDKPLGFLLLNDIFKSGRIFCHTLLFLLSLWITGLLVYRYHRKTWLLVIAFGTLFHLLLDEMWLTPQTLFWPIYGFTFPAAASPAFTAWLQDLWLNLHTSQMTYIPELIGMLVIVCCLIILLAKRKFKQFIVNGYIKK
jgi:inner membrane protein